MYRKEDFMNLTSGKKARSPSRMQLSQKVQSSSSPAHSLMKDYDLWNNAGANVDHDDEYYNYDDQRLCWGAVRRLLRDQGRFTTSWCVSR